VSLGGSTVDELTARQRGRGVCRENVAVLVADLETEST
jgi:hypothetical protein